MESTLSFTTWLLFACIAILIIKFLGLILSVVSFGFIGLLILICIIVIGVGRILYAS